MDQLHKAYKLLRETCDQAFTEEDFDRAYHLLAASTHLAQGLNNAAWLTEISKIAKDYQEKIDKDWPGYQHSSQSSLLRSRLGLFEQLSLTASTASRVVKVHSAKTKGKPLRLDDFSS